jgi:hypothetical protein
MITAPCSNSKTTAKLAMALPKPVFKCLQLPVPGSCWWTLHQPCRTFRSPSFLSPRTSSHNNKVTFFKIHWARFMCWCDQKNLSSIDAPGIIPRLLRYQMLLSRVYTNSSVAGFRDPEMHAPRFMLTSALQRFSTEHVHSCV